MIRPPSRHYKLLQIESIMPLARDAMRSNKDLPLNPHQTILLIETLRLGLVTLYQHPEILDTIELP